MVAHRAHNPKVMWFKSHPRHQIDEKGAYSALFSCPCGGHVLLCTLPCMGIRKCALYTLLINLASKPRIRAHLAPFFVCRLRSCTSMYTPSTANRKKCAICNPSLRFGSLANVCLHCLRRSCTSQCTLPPKIKIRAHLQNEYKGASSAFFRLWVAVIYVLVNSLTPKSKEKRYLQPFYSFWDLG